MRDGGVHFLDARGPEGMRIYAMGDVHGRADLLKLMHEQIEAEIARDRPADWRIIHLGDYVDRGPDSKAVLDFLVAAHRRDERIISLAGNHDVGFLEFLDKPDPATLFARFGGAETARSYGVTLDSGSLAALRESHSALMDAVDDSHVAFLRARPFSTAMGDFFFCHAGIRPEVALDKQAAEDLIWIRADFLDYRALHPKIIVHGHTPFAEPEILPNRVNVDTLAYRSGVLTALVVDGAEKRMLSVRA
ncbi:metallophosphoesterase [Allomesorhizobium alhagi]|nr:metallophosphoesterase [Mesorhizobium alhagi]